MRFIHFRLTGAAIAGIIVLLAAMATFAWYGVAQIDTEARQHQETLVERNIALWTRDIEFSLTAWTTWDESIANIDNRFDHEWTDRNIGASLTGTSRTRFVAVLDANDATIYERTDDTVKDRPFFIRGAQTIVADAAPLVAKVRAQEQTLSWNGIPDPVTFSRIEVLGEEAVLLTASLFQPDFGTSMPKGKRAPVLVTGMPIIGSFQNFFGERFLLDDAQVGPIEDITPDRARAEIAMGPNGEIAVLSWQPPTPAADALHRSMPLILTVIVVLLAGSIFMIRVSRATAKMLLDREQQMRHAATHDFLTGLASRSLLEPEFSRLSAQGPLLVVYVDLDGFKHVNDTHGHAMGDALLKVVAQRLRADIRETDRLFRLGGDEFVILMPAISAAEAQNTCRWLSASLARPVELPGGRKVVIGASFGICDAGSAAGMTCDAAFKAADGALYRAKSLGRGCIVMAGDEQQQQAQEPPALAMARG